MRPPHALAAAVLCAASLFAGPCLWATLAAAGTPLTQIGDAACNRFRDVPNFGRPSVIVPVSSDPSTIFVGATNGGVWRTLNGQTSWDTKTDHFTALRIGALATGDMSPVAHSRRSPARD